jgi:hypothetical protein
MVTGAEPAGKPADADFGVVYVHGYPFTLLSPGISIIMNHTGGECDSQKKVCNFNRWMDAGKIRRLQNAREIMAGGCSPRHMLKNPDEFFSCSGIGHVH